jgi:glucosamine--fructose-6-phosphate aminotransferase (isomerizing)
MAAALTNPQSPNPNPPAAVIGVSVSGGVTRTIEGVVRAAQRGMMTLAITSSNATPIAKAAQRVLTTRVPDVPNAQGVQVPGSRSFFASVVMLYLSAIRLGEMRGNLSATEAEGWRSKLLACADAIRETVRLSDKAARELAEQTLDAREFVFCGSGPNRASALFSAAKLLEASGDPAVAQDVEEWAHLQYFAKTANTPTFLISAGERDASRAEEVRVAMEAIGRRVICISPKVPGTLRYAACDELFAPLVATIPTMLFAAYRAELTCEPYFRNFGGGRSIENGGGISRIRTSELVV